MLIVKDNLATSWGVQAAPWSSGSHAATFTLQTSCIPTHLCCKIYAANVITFTQPALCIYDRQELNPCLLQNFQIPWPISQTLKWKNADKYQTISFFRMVNLHFGWNSISWHFFAKNPKCRFILFQDTNVYLCAKFGDLKPTINESDILKLEFGPISEQGRQGAETTFHKETAIFFRLDVS